MREALIYAFDFEWTNKTIMYGAYARTRLAVPEFRHDGGGPPSPEELEAARAIPRPGARRGVRRAVRAAGLRRVRTGPRAAAQGAATAAGAGLPIKDGKRLLPNGEVFKIEFLIDEPSFQPHHATFIKNLGVLGIEATSASSTPCSIARGSTISIST